MNVLAPARRGAFRWRLPGAAWVAVAAVLALGALVVAAVAIQVDAGLHPGGSFDSALDWQPGRAWPQVWRPWTSAWVHWSGAHLLVNLLGAAVVAGVGWRARASARAALAWFLAWPLTQMLLRLSGGHVRVSKENAFHNLGMQVALVLPFSMLLLVPWGSTR